MRLEGSQAIASNALRQLLEAQTLLNTYLYREADCPSRIRRLVRRTTPFWLRRFILRGARLIWWTVTLQLSGRLNRRRERLKEERPPGAEQPGDVQELIGARFSLAGAIATFPAPDGQPAVSLVTEGLRSTDLVGAVGTAVILGSLLAERLEGRLRLVTRRERGRVDEVAQLLVQNGLRAPRDIELAYAPAGSAESIPVGLSDAFLTTNWRATRAILPAAASARVIQLLEDDERLRYGIGDDRLRCAETLSDPRLRLLIDGELLLKSLNSGPDGLPSLAERAQWFDPAFPERLFHRDAAARHAGERYTLLFTADARGGGPLYWRGLEAISLAIETGLLTRDQWTIVLVGDDLPPVRLPGGILPEVAQDLTLAGYAATLRRADLGLSLAGTPHLSYSSRRLLASGAVVVTDGAPPSSSSLVPGGNVVSSELDVQSLQMSLAVGVSRVRGDASTAAESAHFQLATDWRTSLEMAVSRCAEWIGLR
jgi:hypothetical protein